MLRNITWLGVANILVKPVWFVYITILCTKYLGAEGYGVMIACLSLSYLGSELIDLGTVKYSVREVARDSSLASQFFTNFFLLRLGLAVGAWLLILVAGWVLGYHGTMLLALVFASIYTLTLSLRAYARSILEAVGNLRIESFLLVGERLLVVLGGTVLLVLTHAPQWTLAGMAAGIIGITTIHVIWLARNTAPLTLRLFDPAFLRRSLRISFPFGIIGILGMIYYRIDAVMIEAMLGEAATGHYGIAYQILTGIGILPMIVAESVLFPRFVNLWHNKHWNEFRRLFRQSTFWLGLVSILIALIFTLLAGFIIHIITSDPSFSSSVSTLQILLWSYPFVCLRSLLMVLLIATGEQNSLLYPLAAAALFNVGANFIAISRFGIEGAAFVTLLSEVIILGAYLVRYFRIVAAFPGASFPHLSEQSHSS